MQDEESRLAVQVLMDFVGSLFCNIQRIEQGFCWFHDLFSLQYASNRNGVAQPVLFHLLLFLFSSKQADWMALLTYSLTEWPKDQRDGVNCGNILLEEMPPVVPLTITCLRIHSMTLSLSFQTFNLPSYASSNGRDFPTDARVATEQGVGCTTLNHRVSNFSRPGSTG